MMFLLNDFSIPKDKVAEVEPVLLGAVEIFEQSKRSASYVQDYRKILLIPYT